MDIALSTTLHTSFDDAVSRTRDALAQHGFGVLTEIDVKATLKAKLDEDVADYLILGACNPGFAHQAVSTFPQVGVLLPCNVVVRRDPDSPETIVIDAMDPRLMTEVTEDPGMRGIADDVRGLLQQALKEIANAA
jgi:uncharacterized protein (DUF302 family)